MTRPAPRTDLDCPIPFTLTPKALAMLAADPGTDPGAEAGEWACIRCADAWFGTPPGDGLCQACRPGPEPS